MEMDQRTGSFMKLREGVITDPAEKALTIKYNEVTLIRMSEALDDNSEEVYVKASIRNRSSRDRYVNLFDP
uniref:Uncharacterized protein n=1 Tax=Vespula pensylvanica TaxID=30213 RepID=A0A834UET6_VESPE|nr:hypothetical protein H0235_002957 [Vespula pensylvanica]